MESHFTLFQCVKGEINSSHQNTVCNGATDRLQAANQVIFASRVLQSCGLWILPEKQAEAAYSEKPFPVPKELVDIQPV